MSPFTNQVGGGWSQLPPDGGGWGGVAQAGGGGGNGPGGEYIPPEGYGNITGVNGMPASSVSAGFGFQGAGGTPAAPVPSAGGGGLTRGAGVIPSPGGSNQSSSGGSPTSNRYSGTDQSQFGNGSGSASALPTGGSPTAATTGQPASSAGFDDGGDVADNSNTPSLDDALSTIKDTLNYGRQKNGLGGQQDDQAGVLPDPNAKFSGMRPSTNVEDDRPQTQVGQAGNPTPKVNNMGLIPQGTPQMPNAYPYNGAAQIMGDPNQANPAQSFADGGDMSDPSSGGMPQQPQTNQPTPQQGQTKTNATAPPSMVGYAMGSDAASPDVALALERKVDPQGKMDGSQRKMLAIASAGDPQSQWAMMQHYRQKFNAYSSFARAALQGNQQKPGDIHAAANAATQAYENVPDGTQTRFTPVQGGVQVHVHRFTGGKDGSSGKSQGFDDGGDVQDTPIPQDEGEAMGQAFAVPGKGGTEAPAEPTQEGGQKQDFTAVIAPQQLDQLLAQHNFDQPMDNSIEATIQKFMPPGGAAQGTNPGSAPYNSPSGGANPNDVSVLPEHPTPEQIQKFNQSNGGTNRPQFQGTGIDPDLQREADALFPNASQTAQRQKYIQDQTGTQKTQKAAIELQKEKNIGLKDEWGVRGNTAINVQQMKGDVSTANNQRTVAGRLAVAITQRQGADLRSQQSNLIKHMDSLAMSNPAFAKDPASLLKAIAPAAIQLGLNPRAVAAAYSQQLQQGQQPQEAQVAGQDEGSQGAPPARPGMKYVKGKWYTQGPNGEAVEVGANGLPAQQ